VSLICCCQFHVLLHLLGNHLYLRFLKGLVTTYLLDNFLNLLWTFSGFGERSRGYDLDWKGVRRES
jgi:hypothetical protein